MATKKITENPKITDTILLEITTLNSDDCFATPYRVDSVVVYFVERDALGANYGEYTTTTIPDELREDLAEAEAAVCDDDSLYNQAKLEKIKSEIQSSAQSNTFYYKDRVAVHVIGTEELPAWLSTDTDNALLTLESEDEDGNAQVGHFSYEWNPKGSIREGDYFVCWTYTPLVSGEKLYGHLHFYVDGDGLLVATIPTHKTPADKYETLLERYLPDMYKYMLSDNDQTPVITDRLNKSIAKGFTFLEDMANQIIDLFDANSLHESMLSYLSNTLSLKLKSDDPTLWRRQIKEAVPLFKKKGTLEGLSEAFAQAGMTLNTFTQYWQVTSPYTWTESFKVTDSIVFELEKPDVIETDGDNFGLWLKREGETEYEEITVDYVTFEEGIDGIIRMTWVGDTLSSSPVSLSEGDTIKILYQYAEIDDQSVEDYIQALPLMDQRDDNDQDYPPKNWNVRLIAEDDPLFDTLVPHRHPFVDPLVFGQVRTEFAYSENMYNADEYNGSIRPSYDPCRIDKSFVDPCSACLSSSYSVDIGVEELSNDRMLEAQEILKEYTPFHAQLHSITFTGDVNEFVPPPSEKIDMLVTVDYMQYILSGNNNVLFGRNMEGGLSNWVITRDDLTDQLTVLSGKLGTAYNQQITFIAPDDPLDSLGIIPENHILEILAPSANAGTYTIDDFDGHLAKVTSSVNEPLDEAAFTYVLSNVLYESSVTTILQNDLVKISDDELDFATLGVKTQWDVDNTPDYTGGSWKVLIPAYSATAYEIVNIVEGVLTLDGDENLPTSNVSGVSYSLLNDEDEVVDTSTTGSLSVLRRGHVNLNDSNITDLSQFARAGDYLLYDGSEYKISTLDGTNFWIDDYVDGEASGVTTQIRRRLVDEGIGYFGYRGLLLTTFSDHESEFGIVNGNNPPAEDYVTDDSNFKENYMFKIGEEYYKILSIDGDEVVLSGRDQSWMTTEAGGTAVAYSVIHFAKQEINVGFTVFDHLDRDGQDVVIRELYSEIDQSTAIAALSAPSGSGVQDNVSQQEGVSYIIEMRNGETEQGDL